MIHIRQLDMLTLSSLLCMLPFLQYVLSIMHVPWFLGVPEWSNEVTDTLEHQKFNSDGVRSVDERKILISFFQRFRHV